MSLYIVIMIILSRFKIIVTPTKIFIINFANFAIFSSDNAASCADRKMQASLTLAHYLPKTNHTTRFFSEISYGQLSQYCMERFTSSSNRQSRPGKKLRLSHIFPTYSVKSCSAIRFFSPNKLESFKALFFQTVENSQ